MVSSSQCCCVRSSTNAITLLEFCFTVYPFLAPRIADTTIMYSHKVLKYDLIVNLIISLNTHTHIQDIQHHTSRTKAI